MINERWIEQLAWMRGQDGYPPVALRNLWTALFKTRVPAK
jgi:hypothetical protein